MATHRVSHAAAAPAVVPSTVASRAGWLISGLVILFMLVDGIMKVVRTNISIDATVELGYPESQVAWIGLAVLICAVLYAIPLTAMLGTILLTGFLGGAIASQVRLEEPSALFPAALGILAWVGLALRDERARRLFR